MSNVNNVSNCYVIIMKGTYGSGKTTLANFIEDKYTKLGFNVYNESIDKYCRDNIAPKKAGNIIHDVLKKAVKLNNKCIVIIDTCGESKTLTPFNVNFEGWKTIVLRPNYDENNKLGYLSWSLINIIVREKASSNSSYYLSTYIDGADLCKELHKKKAILLGMYDNNFNKLTVDEIIKYASDYKVPQINFDLINGLLI